MRKTSVHPSELAIDVCDDASTPSSSGRDPLLSLPSRLSKIEGVRLPRLCVQVHLAKVFMWSKQNTACIQSSNRFGSISQTSLLPLP